MHTRSDMKELALPSSWCAPHSFPAASTRALISLLVPAAPATTATTTIATATTEQPASSCATEEELQTGERPRLASSAPELQLQQFAVVVVVVVCTILQKQKC